MLAAVLREGGFRVERAVVEAIDESPAIGGSIDESRDLAVDAIDILLAVAAAGDAPLVGHDHEAVSGIAKSDKSFRDSFEEDHA